MFNVKTIVAALACTLVAASWACAADAPPAQLPPGTSYARPGSQFAVTQIRPTIFAISEPGYYQHNVSYVIVGEDRALVVDAGASTTEDITQVVRLLTDKPFAVLPSHLHYDHVGGIHRFREIWMIDTPPTRALAGGDGLTRIPVERHIAAAGEFSSTPFKVSRYIRSGETVELGDKPVQVIAAPGHTPDEIVVFSPLDNVLFAGDFIYPAGLFSGNAADYLASMTKLLSDITPQTVIYGAHPGRPINGTREMPLVSYDEMLAVRDTLQRMNMGKPADEVVADPSPTGNFKMTAAKIFSASPRIRIFSDIVFADRPPFTYQGR